MAFIYRFIPGIKYTAACLGICVRSTKMQKYTNTLVCLENKFWQEEGCQGVGRRHEGRKDKLGLKLVENKPFSYMHRAHKCRLQLLFFFFFDLFFCLHLMQRKFSFFFIFSYRYLFTYFLQAFVIPALTKKHLVMTGKNS